MWLSDRIDQDYTNRLNRWNQNHVYGASAGPCPIFPAVPIPMQDGDQDGIYAAFTAALAKKVFGSTSKVRKIIKKALKESEGK